MTLQQMRGFRILHVFDISQTEGDDLPDLDAVGPNSSMRTPRGDLGFFRRSSRLGYEVITWKSGTIQRMAAHTDYWQKGACPHGRYPLT